MKSIVGATFSSSFFITHFLVGISFVSIEMNVTENDLNEELKLKQNNHREFLLNLRFRECNMHLKQP